MEEVILTINDKPDITIQANLIAQVDCVINLKVNNAFTSNATVSHSGKSIAIYQTSDGFLGYRKGEIQREQEMKNLITFFGYSDEAKQLYKEAGIDATITLEEWESKSVDLA